MKKFIYLILFFTQVTNIFSQEVNINEFSKKEIIKIFREYISNRDENILGYIEVLDVQSPDYVEIEEFITSSVDELIKNGDLDFPLKLVEYLLYNNLENSYAQEQYSIIIDKKIEFEERLEAEKLIADKRRITIQQEKVLLNKEFSKEEELSGIIKEHIENIKYLSGFTNSYNKVNYVSTSFIYPILSRFYSSEVYSGYNNIENYINSYSGVGFDLGLGLDLSLFSFKLDTTCNFTFNDFLWDNIKQLTGNVSLSLGLNLLDFPVYLRFGFLSDNYFYDSISNSDVAITNLPSATVGVGIINFTIYDFIKFDFSSDVLLAYTYTRNLDFGIYNKLYITLNLFRFGVYNFELKGGLDSIYLNESGLFEYSLQPRFGFGVNAYE